MRFPRLFPRSKKQVALSPAPGHYSNDDPEKIIFDQGTRLRIEANHWKTFCFTPGAVATPRAWCPTNGAMAQNSDGRGQMLSCQDHAWLPIGGPALRHGYFMVQNGWGVPAPNCATGGTPQIVFSPVSFYVNPTATVNVSASGSGPWTVFITDGNGNGISGTAVVETYCSY